MNEKRFIEDFNYLINYPKHHCVFDGIQQKNLELDEIVALLNQLYDENRELRQTMQKVCELLEEEVDLFSDEATEHDVIAYSEMQDFDNKDAYYICTATKKAIQMLKGGDSDE